MAGVAGEGVGRWWWFERDGNGKEGEVVAMHDDCWKSICETRIGHELLFLLPVTDFG